jgi:DNA topoisomerase 2-associated protein PAT1
MAFFGLPDNELPRVGPDEDLAVYTWGEDSYDGLGDALQEGGDDLNDETFGSVGTVGQYCFLNRVQYFSLSLSGKDFDFAGLPENHQSQNRLQALESRGHGQTLSPAAKPVQTSAILILFMS